jgi:hypothetical protein
MKGIARRRVAIVALLGAAASVVAIGTASGSRGTASRADMVHRTSAVARMSVTSTSVKRVLLSNEGTAQPGEFQGSTGTCPKKYPTPVSGWFSAKSDKVVLAESIPVGAHKWAVGVTNLDTAPSDYIIGVVCVK